MWHYKTSTSVFSLTLAYLRSHVLLSRTHSHSHYSACEIKTTRTRFDSFWSRCVRKALPAQWEKNWTSVFSSFFQATIFLPRNLILWIKWWETSRFPLEFFVADSVCVFLYVCVCARKRENVRESELDRECQRENVWEIFRKCDETTCVCSLDGPSVFETEYASLSVLYHLCFFVYVCCLSLNV